MGCEVSTPVAPNRRVVPQPHSAARAAPAVAAVTGPGAGATVQQEPPLASLSGGDEKNGAFLMRIGTSVRSDLCDDVGTVSASHDFLARNVSALEDSPFIGSCDPSTLFDAHLWVPQLALAQNTLPRAVSTDSAPLLHR